MASPPSGKADPLAGQVTELESLLYWGVWVKPSGHANQVVEPLAGSVLLSEVDPVAAS
jgi:ligand-binding sensor domain-containing protein